MFKHASGDGWVHDEAVCSVKSKASQLTKEYIVVEIAHTLWAEWLFDHTCIVLL